METAICWKGLAAIFIMLGHICPNNAPLLIKFLLSGNLWVGLFFFYSGYGLQYSLDHNRYYICNGFIKHKLKNVYIPFLFAETIFTILLIMKGELAFDLIKFLTFCAGIRLANSVLWYVIEILIIYSIFWCINRFVPKWQWLWIVCFSLFLGIAVVKDIGTWWYISTSCFLLGLYYKETNRLLGKQKLKGLKTISFVLFVLLYCFNKLCLYNVINIEVLPQNYIITALDMLLAPLFICVCATISGFLSIRNKVLIYIGYISYEIYLYHMLIKRIFENICGDTFVAVFIISVVTIIVGAMIFLLRNKVSSVRRKSKNN